MTTFVLVHGAWHGGWCWARVRTRLFQMGHEVASSLGLRKYSHVLNHFLSYGQGMFSQRNMELHVAVEFWRRGKL